MPTTAIEMGTNPMLKNSAAVDDVDVGVGVTATATDTEMYTNPMLKNLVVPAPAGRAGKHCGPKALRTLRAGAYACGGQTCGPGTAQGPHGGQACGPCTSTIKNP